ncbi:hypothetical protein SAMN06269173_11183 [Hymenobacter mucosus]|uniref:Uncharacterized protein n=1 Tax=Hymenobacter mucosus TaxID=1411120 RepID=A0A239AA44_9BACT|nr:hypothetical protein SAMN06269173_11183 [Hymenobacter mucosus]
MRLSKHWFQAIALALFTLARMAYKVDFRPYTWGVIAAAMVTSFLILLVLSHVTLSWLKWLIALVTNPKD